MSKYSPLWEYIVQNDPDFVSFAEIEKKELENFADQVQKISMKNGVGTMKKLTRCDSQDVRNLLPVTKHDHQHIDELLQLSDEEIEPIMPELLTWLQDINWPIAGKIKEVISGHRKIAEPYILEILQGTDEMWKYNILSYLLDDWDVIHLNDLKNEISRIANQPINEERLEEVDRAAQNYLWNRKDH